MTDTEHEINNMSQITRTLENKRTHSVISSNESQSEITLDQTNQKLNKKKNKIELQEPNNELNTENSVSNLPQKETIKEDEIDKKLRYIKDYLNKAGTLFNYIQFKSLIENTKSSKKNHSILYCNILKT